MRTTERDKSRFMTVYGFVENANSGSGVAQPGSIPFTYVSPSGGAFEIRFGNPGFKLISVGGNVHSTNPYILVAQALGTWSRQYIYTTAGALAGASFGFTMTMRDNRL